MADEQPIGADDVARKQFATAFRGFDQYEVRAFLAQVAAELSSLHERERALREQLATAVAQPAHRPVGEDELEAALGVETTRVLHAAREAAAEIRAKAEESVARMLREVNDEAGRMKAEAETILGRRTEEAEAASSAILSAAEETAAILRTDAEGSAAAAIDDAQQRGREMVAEAQAVRERVLKDLARRRKAAAAQLEQLLAGRQRLLSAYDVVRGTLDEATHELTVAESEARLAAEAAGLRAPAEDEAPTAPEPSPEPEAVAVEPERRPEPEPEPVASDATEASDGSEAAARPVTIVPPLTQAPAPEPGDTTSGDDRRSSSLRLLRRKGEAPDVPLLDDVEGVRVIRSEPAAATPRPTVVPDLSAPEPESAAEAAAQPVATAVDEKPVDDLFARLRADRAAAVAHAEEVLAPETELELPEAPAPGLVTVDDAVFEQRDAAVESAERALTRALKRALADEQNEVLDALRRLRGAPVLDDLLPAADEHAGRFAAVATEHLMVGSAAGAASLGGDAPEVEELANALAVDVTDDVRARLERALDVTGGDEESLLEAISATYREWKTARSEPLARHHLAAAYALGAFAAAPVDELRWVVDHTEGGCPDCDDNALAGPTRKGHAFPTGQVHPPAHAGCRCLVLPAS